MNRTQKQDMDLQSDNKTEFAETHATPKILAGKYQYLRKIGQGSQAKVYQAVRLKDHQMVCIKQLDIESVSSWKEYELFQREAKVLSSLDINGVAMFYEAIEDLNSARPCAFIVQEFIEGESLADMLKAGHRFDVKEVYDILIQLLRIIYQLQDRPDPVIHRDIKPSNIMLTNVNLMYYVTLVDFGAVANPQVQSGGSTTAGTFGYMAPEQCTCHTCPASDIYSLAAVAVEMFSGKSPTVLPVKDFRLIFEPELENQPPALVNTLRSMLDPDYKKRLADPVKLIEIFKRFQKGDFEFIQKTQKQTPADKFEKALAEVKEIGAPGNFDLWQTLPDETPRQIPSAYKEADWSPKPETQAKISVDNNEAEQLSLKLHAVSMIFVLAILVGFILLVMFTTMGPDKGEAQIFLTTIIITIGGIAILAGGGYITEKISDSIAAWIINLKAKKLALSQSKTKDTDLLPSMPNPVFDLIRNGRKTIATIVDIEYIPIANAWNQNQLMVTHERPRFKVKYKFNPPDDALGEKDQIHYCTVFTDPENSYRVGDPIPILYSFVGYHTIDEIVRSMIFPAPLDYICERFVVCQMQHTNTELRKLIKRYHNHCPLVIPIMERLLKARSNVTELALILKRSVECPSFIDGNPFDVCTYLLELLNIFIQTSFYSAMHADCLRLMFMCFEQSGDLMEKMYPYIMEYLNQMCVPGNIVAPDAFEVLREAHHIELMQYNGDTRLVRDISRIALQNELCIQSRYL